MPASGHVDREQQRACRTVLACFRPYAAVRARAAFHRRKRAGVEADFIHVSWQLVFRTPAFVAPYNRRRGMRGDFDLGGSAFASSRAEICATHSPNRTRHELAGGTDDDKKKKTFLKKKRKYVRLQSTDTCRSLNTPRCSEENRGGPTRAPAQNAEAYCIEVMRTTAGPEGLRQGACVPGRRRNALCFLTTAATARRSPRGLQALKNRASTLKPIK